MESLDDDDDDDARVVVAVVFPAARILWATNVLGIEMGSLRLINDCRFVVCSFSCSSSIDAVSNEGLIVGKLSDGVGDVDDKV